MLLLLITYEQLSQILVMFRAAKTVLAVAISTVISEFWVFSPADVRFRLMPTSTTKYP